jgi:hypothetical protein
LGFPRGKKRVEKSIYRKQKAEPNLTETLISICLAMIVPNGRKEVSPMLLKAVNLINFKIMLSFSRLQLLASRQTIQ